MVRKDLLEILACPACRADVIERKEKIVCTQCQRIYPINDDVPIMLVEEERTER